MSGGAEGPGGNTEQENKKIETGKPLEEYREAVAEIHTDGEIMQEDEIAQLLKSVDEASHIPDLEKRKLFDEARAEINSIPENTRTHMLDFMDEMRALEKDNTNIPENANITQVAEFMNTEYMESTLSQLGSMDVSHMLPEGTDLIALQMFMSKELTGILNTKYFQKIMDSQRIDSLEGTQIKPNFGLEISEAIIKFMDEVQKGQGEEALEKFKAEAKVAMDKSLGEGAFSEVTTSALAIQGDIEGFKKNLTFVKETKDIDFERTTVIDYIGDIPVELTEENKAEHITELLRLSGDETYDRDTALEEKVAEINKVFEGEGAQDLMDGIKQTGAQLSDTIIKLSNESGLGKMFAKLFQEGGPLAFLATLFGPEFKEAISEGNLKKQKALFNLVAISSTKTSEGFKISGTDFSNIKSSDLKEFFASMDSHGIDYSRDNFWEHLMTGEVQDGPDGEAAVDIIHTQLKGDSDNIFTKEDFADNNKLFLERLNVIVKKDEEGSEESGEDETEADTNPEENNIEAIG